MMLDIWLSVSHARTHTHISNVGGHTQNGSEAAIQRAALRGFSKSVQTTLY